MPQQPTEILDVLALAHAHIQYGWCQDAEAKFSIGGQEVGPSDPDATRWCALGALNAACFCLDASYDLRRCVSDLIESSLTGDWKREGYVGFNDEAGRKRQAILALFERAAQKVGKR